MSSLQALKDFTTKLHVVNCDNNRVYITDFEKVSINEGWVHKRVEVVDVKMCTVTWMALDLLHVKIRGKYVELTTLGDF